MIKKMYRSKKDRKIAGVCGGLGIYLEVDPVIFRILFIFLTFMGGSGLLIYLILLLVMPEEPYNLIIDEPVQEAKVEQTQVNETVNEKSEQTVEAEEVTEKVEGEQRCSRMSFGTICGLILIVCGLFFLGNKYLPRFRFDLYFPLFVIFMGFLLMIMGFISKKK